MDATRRAGALVVVVLLVWAAALRGEPVAVRHPEGVVHGFLVLRTLAGTTIGTGELLQVPRGAQIETRLTLRFKDGSLHEETALFSQRGQFRLIRDRLVQRGPSFPRALDMSIDTDRGVVTVRHSGDGTAKEAQESEHLAIPPDLANGLVATLLKNVRAAAPPASFSFIVATPRPRLIHLKVASAGEDRFRIGGEEHAATHYVLTPEIGGLAGMLASLVGRRPPDSHVWILGGAAPAFVRSDQPLYLNGPLWRIELTAPTWREGTPGQ